MLFGTYTNIDISKFYFNISRTKLQNLLMLHNSGQNVPLHATKYKCKRSKSRRSQTLMLGRSGYNTICSPPTITYPMTMKEFPMLRGKKVSNRYKWCRNALFI